MIELSIYDILMLISTHLVADFILQDEADAANKWKDFRCLIRHTSLYASAATIFVYIHLCILGEVSDYPDPYGWKLGVFFLVILATHTATDFFTSKVVHRQFKEGHIGSSIPNFGAFTTIGIGQWAHYAQLFITYGLLFE